MFKQLFRIFLLQLWNARHQNSIFPPCLCKTQNVSDGLRCQFPQNCNQFLQCKQIQIWISMHFWKISQGIFVIVMFYIKCWDWSNSCRKSFLLFFSWICFLSSACKHRVKQWQLQSVALEHLSLTWQKGGRMSNYKRAFLI